LVHLKDFASSIRLELPLDRCLPVTRTAAMAGVFGALRCVAITASIPSPLNVRARDLALAGAAACSPTQPWRPSRVAKALLAWPGRRGGQVALLLVAVLAGLTTNWPGVSSASSSGHPPATAASPDHGLLVMSAVLAFRGRRAAWVAQPACPWPVRRAHVSQHRCVALMASWRAVSSPPATPLAAP